MVPGPPWPARIATTREAIPRSGKPGKANRDEPDCASWGFLLPLRAIPKWSIPQMMSWFGRRFGIGDLGCETVAEGRPLVRGPKPIPCTFPDDFVQAARDTVGRRTVAVQTVQRFRLVLLLHEHPDLSHDDAARIVGLSSRQVQRWRQRWAHGDFDIEDRRGRGRKPIFSPAGSGACPGDGL